MRKFTNKEISELFNMYGFEISFGQGKESYISTIEWKKNAKLNYKWFITTGTLCSFNKKGGYFKNTGIKTLDPEEICNYIRRTHNTN